MRNGSGFHGEVIRRKGASRNGRSMSTVLLRTGHTVTTGKDPMVPIHFTQPGKLTAFLPERAVPLTDLRRVAGALFRQAGLETPRLDADLLLAHCRGCARHMLYLDGSSRLTEDEWRLFVSCVNRRLSGEPLAYITGCKEFWSRDFEVCQDVLVPRPETECLVEEAIRCLNNAANGTPHVLEIGTGSGAISIILACERPDAVYLAGDISRKALAVARRNAHRHGVSSRMRFFCGDMCASVRGRFDLILSNPPYLSWHDRNALSRDGVCREPRRALVAGPMGTECHRVLIAQAPDRLIPGGRLIMEIGDGQRSAVEDLFLATPAFHSVSFRADAAGVDRVVTAVRGRIDG